jgi:hypothetical protein
MMESRFKSNNFIAILIAVILVATGFALAFLHRHSESAKDHGKKPVAELSTAAMDKGTRTHGNTSG